MLKQNQEYHPKPLKYRDLPTLIYHFQVRKYFESSNLYEELSDHAYSVSQERVGQTNEEFLIQRINDYEHF